MFSKAIDKQRQRESIAWRRGVAIAAVAAFAWSAHSVRADDKLDPAGATFRDYATLDNGASFFRVEGMTSGGGASDQTPAKLVGTDNEKGTARVRFETVKIEVTLPMGWLAAEDWERGVGFSGDRRFRLITWRIDFPFEGVKDAEHYAATKSGAIQARRPQIRAQARKLGDGTFLIIYENVPPGRGDSENRVVFDIVIPKSPGGAEGALLTLGVPASDTERGLRLMALIKASAKVDW